MSRDNVKWYRFKQTHSNYFVYFGVLELQSSRYEKNEQKKKIVVGIKK